MSVMPILLVAAMTGPAWNGDAKAFSCDLAVPGGSRFRLEGNFDQAGLRSNLSTLTSIEGTFSTGEIIINSGGPTQYRWTLPHGSVLPPSSGDPKLDVHLINYGSQAAVMSVVRTDRGGRHDRQSLIGVGLCDVTENKVGIQ